MNVYGVDSIESRMMSFTTLIVCELLRAYSSRSNHLTLRKIGVFSNKSMVYASIFSFALLLLVLYIPFLNNIFKVSSPSLSDWIVILLFAIIPVAIGELRKAIKNKKRFQLKI